MCDKAVSEMGQDQNIPEENSVVKSKIVKYDPVLDEEYGRKLRSRKKEMSQDDKIILKYQEMLSDKPYNETLKLKRVMKNVVEVPNYGTLYDDEDDKQSAVQVWAANGKPDGEISTFLSLARVSLTYMQENMNIDQLTSVYNTNTDFVEQYALDFLHNANYDEILALRRMQNLPVPLRVYQKWTKPEIDLFLSGLEKHGKNFHMIQKSVFPTKTVPELVKFYYDFKKSIYASNIRSENRWPIRKKIKTTEEEPREINGTRRTRAAGACVSNDDTNSNMAERLNGDKAADDSAESSEARNDCVANNTRHHYLRRPIVATNGDKIRTKKSQQTKFAVRKSRRTRGISANEPVL